MSTTSAPTTDDRLNFDKLLYRSDGYVITQPDLTFNADGSITIDKDSAFAILASQMSRGDGRSIVLTFHVRSQSPRERMNRRANDLLTGFPEATIPSITGPTEHGDESPPDPEDKIKG